MMHTHPTRACFLSSPGFFPDEKSGAQAEFVKAANTLREKYRFAHTNSEAVLQSQGLGSEYVHLQDTELQLTSPFPVFFGTLMF